MGSTLSRSERARFSSELENAPIQFVHRNGRPGAHDGFGHCNAYFGNNHGRRRQYEPGRLDRVYGVGVESAEPDQGHVLDGYDTRTDSPKLHTN